jgi:hypothetical protein
VSIFLLKEADVRVRSEADARLEALAASGSARGGDGSCNIVVGERRRELQDTLTRSLIKD